MADPSGSLSGLIASWFTPSSLFIVVNLVIGTIAISSRFGAPKTQTHDSPQLVRSPSLRDRVRSFKLAHYNHDPPTQAETECTQPQLVRSPSLLERVRSFRLSHDPTTFAETEPTQPQLVRTPSLLERVRSFKMGFHNYQPSHAETEYAQPNQPEPENPPQPQLNRAPSLLQRLQSRLYRSESINGEENLEPETEGSGSDPGEEGGNVVGMMKSRSERRGSRRSEWEEDEGEVERRRPMTARSESETTSWREDEEVDAKADDFINKFKKQLRLQRLDSFLRYKEMLTGS